MAVKHKLHHTPLMYLIVHGKTLSQDILRGIKISSNLHDIIELEDDYYIIIRKIDDPNQRNHTIIHTIQKVYDLLVNKTIKMFIVDNIDVNTAHDNKNDPNRKIMSLDELYTTLDFKYVAKTVSRGGQFYLAISYIPPESEVHTTHLFTTSPVSKELFERAHMLNNYNTKGIRLDFDDNTEKEKIECASSDSILTHNICPICENKQNDKSGQNDNKKYDKKIIQKIYNEMVDIDIRTTLMFLVGIYFASWHQGFYFNKILHNIINY